MKSVKIHYFAVLRECAGKSGETVETNAVNYQELYDELMARYKFPLEASRVRVAIGDEYVALDQEIADGADVTFIPPVAGG